MRNLYHGNFTVYIAFALFFGVSQAFAADFLIADKTYEGQATQLSNMPDRFSAQGRFKTSQVTVMCPEAPKYRKINNNAFLTNVDKIETGLRAPLPEMNDMGKQYLEFVTKTELCRKLDAGTFVDISGAVMNFEGCFAGWMPDEYTHKYPSTASFACFYYPLTKVDGVLYAVPSLHLIGFDEWASQEWKKHKL